VKRARPAAIFAVLAVLAVFGLFFFRRPERSAGPLPQEAYVWQRSWGPETRAALTRSSGLAGFVVLAAEVDLSTEPPRVSAS
jgi:hypothetical protein